MRPHPELVAAAHHEAGHAVAIVAAFKKAPWLPKPPPPLLVRYVEITQNAAGQWTGCCVGPDIYSVKWDIACIAEPYRDLMEAQVVIHLAGGIAEWLYRGEPLPVARCGMDADLQKAFALMDGDLFRLTGRHHALAPFIERTRELLTERWDAVSALALELIEHGRIEGERVQVIINQARSR